MTRRDPARDFAVRYCFFVEAGTRAFRRYARFRIEQAVKRAADEMPTNRSGEYQTAYLDALSAIRTQRVFRKQEDRP